MGENNETAMQRRGEIDWKGPVQNTTTLVAVVGSQAKRIEKIAGSRVDVERMSMLAMLAAQKNPDILKCSAQSVFMSLLDAAKVDLDVDGIEGALVPFRKKDKASGRYETLCSFMPMYQGLVARALADEVISSVFAAIAYENDEFDVSLGTEQRITHRPVFRDRGAVKCVYAVATYPNGDRKFEVMTVEEIEKVRAASKTGQYGPWADWWEEMAKKTVIKRLLKTAGRKTGRLREALAIDNRFESQERRPRDVNMEHVRSVLASTSAPQLTSGREPDDDASIYDEDDDDMHEIAKRHAREAAEAADAAFSDEGRDHGRE